VTGATQPVGKAIVHELAAHGAGLADEDNKAYPSTKVIGYDFGLANEEDTLGLIDDVLNAWGRYGYKHCTTGVLC
jgi:NAD(P)-dependent dehydrogenase (short-subunit alcohol dehydrogenase family)